MILLLPPSETKRDGGDASRVLDLGVLSFQELSQHRRKTLAALTTVSRSVKTANAALKLGPKQGFEIERNRSIRRSPIMPAIERYTGVLYDALEADSLSEEVRRFAGRSVVVHSALFGLLGANDPIPAYRLSHDSRLPGLSLRTHWRDVTARALSSKEDFVIDLRSEAYAALGPRPERSTYIRVVTETADGARLAVSHFNKKAKGEFTRAVLSAGIVHTSANSLVEWARDRGIRLEPGSGNRNGHGYGNGKGAGAGAVAGELDLVVAEESASVRQQPLK